MCSIYWGITFFSFPGKVTSRVLERSVRLLVKARIQEEQWGFRPGCGTEGIGGSMGVAEPGGGSEDPGVELQLLCIEKSQLR